MFACVCECACLCLYMLGKFKGGGDGGEVWSIPERTQLDECVCGWLCGLAEVGKGWEGGGGHMCFNAPDGFEEGVSVHSITVHWGFEQYAHE